MGEVEYERRYYRCIDEDGVIYYGYLVDEWVDKKGKEKLSENVKETASRLSFYTTYLAAAKRLQISAGVGNNMFAPKKEITRQEMFTLLHNALKVIGKLPEDDSGKALSDFSDNGDIASWAKDAVALLVETGTICGSSGGKLAPADTTTRAEMAQVLYSLLFK